MASGIVHTPEFGRLLGRAISAPIIKRELDSSLVPSAYGEQETWETLTAIRRAQGYQSPRLANEQGPVYWHTVTHSMESSLREIDRLVSTGSELDTYIATHQDKNFLTQQFIEEIVTCLRYDGHLTDYESIRDVIVGNRPPLSTAEHLARRFQQLVVRLGEFAALPFDRSTLLFLYEQLTDGVGSDSLDLPPTTPLVSYYSVGATRPSSSYPLDKTLDFISAQACQEVGEHRRHPFMISMLVHCRFWHNEPFPRYNNLIGYIVSRYFLTREGYSVLRYVPKVQLVEEWRTGTSLVSLPYTFDEARVVEGDSVDWTAYYDCVLKLTLFSIQKMAKTFSQSQSIDDAAIAAVEAQRNLNSRQKDALRQCVRLPEKSYSIAAYQRDYGVSYSSARNDLTELVALGLFVQTVKGRGHWYQGIPHLRSQLADLEAR